MSKVRFDLIIYVELIEDDGDIKTRGGKTTYLDVPREQVERIEEILNG